MKINTLFFSLSLISFSLFSQSKDIKLYTLEALQKDTAKYVGFVSLTGNFEWSTGRDSLEFPNTYLGSDYHTLSKDYRSQFLAKVKISESDSVFVYNYTKDSVFTYPVKKLPIIAYANAYSGNSNQSDYLIGFDLEDEINIKNWPSYYNTFVFVGKNNPFITGNIKPLIWREINDKAYPIIKLSHTDDILLKNKTITGSYIFTTNTLNYYIHLLKGNDDDTFDARHLIIMDSKNQHIIYNKIYEDIGESGSLAPLSFINDSDNETYQWTGQILKNKPPVLFGFYFISFGCPSIHFIDKSIQNLWIYCDNRH
ncbi:hypothetical protein [Psychroserpens sp. NJDZ02]|uniref:hypothetical protein n=1 Tax=Psychroserpens sp. NJDZ02 TaxID=2570561 RepID=UPI0010A778F9|nr:hypothetical protein [Psychroserpens sp. NJDZ02]QCE40570.1 hypothetical protein E9099_03765 [Psychroserpens sp. NJDZ02]